MDDLANVLAEAHGFRKQGKQAPMSSVKKAGYGVPGGSKGSNGLGSSPGFASASVGASVRPFSGSPELSSFGTSSGLRGNDDLFGSSSRPSGSSGSGYAGSTGVMFDDQFGKPGASSSSGQSEFAGGFGAGKVSSKPSVTATASAFDDLLGNSFATQSTTRPTVQKASQSTPSDGDLLGGLNSAAAPVPRHSSPKPSTSSSSASFIPPSSTTASSATGATSRSSSGNASKKAPSHLDPFASAGFESMFVPPKSTPPPAEMQPAAPAFVDPFDSFGSSLPAESGPGAFGQSDPTSQAFGLSGVPAQGLDVDLDGLESFVMGGSGAAAPSMDSGAAAAAAPVAPSWDDGLETDWSAAVDAAAAAAAGRPVKGGPAEFGGSGKGSSPDENSAAAAAGGVGGGRDAEEVWLTVDDIALKTDPSLTPPPPSRPPPVPSHKRPQSGHKEAPPAPAAAAATPADGYAPVADDLQGFEDFASASAAADSAARGSTESAQGTDHGDGMGGFEEFASGRGGEEFAGASKQQGTSRSSAPTGHGEGAEEGVKGGRRATEGERDAGDGRHNVRKGNEEATPQRRGRHQRQQQQQQEDEDIYQQQASAAAATADASSSAMKDAMERAQRKAEAVREVRERERVRKEERAAQKQQQARAASDTEPVPPAVRRSSSSTHVNEDATMADLFGSSSSQPHGSRSGAGTSSEPRHRPAGAGVPSSASAAAAPGAPPSSADAWADILGGEGGAAAFAAQFSTSSSTPNAFEEVPGESEERRKLRMERLQRVQDRATAALDEKKRRDVEAQNEQDERHRAGEMLDFEIKRWAAGKEGNLRALLSTLHFALWPEANWQPLSITDLITAAAVKKAYRKAALCVHPDKVQQKGATTHQKYIAEKVFDLLKEAFNKFNSEELF